MPDTAINAHAVKVQKNLRGFISRKKTFRFAKKKVKDTKNRNLIKSKENFNKKAYNFTCNFSTKEVEQLEQYLIGKYTDLIDLYDVKTDLGVNKETRTHFDDFYFPEEDVTKLKLEQRLVVLYYLGQQFDFGIISKKVKNLHFKDSSKASQSGFIKLLIPYFEFIGSEAVEHSNLRDSLPAYSPEKSHKRNETRFSAISKHFTPPITISKRNYAFEVKKRSAPSEESNNPWKPNLDLGFLFCTPQPEEASIELPIYTLTSSEPVVAEFREEDFQLIDNNEMPKFIEIVSKQRNLGALYYWDEVIDEESGLYFEGTFSKIDGKKNGFGLEYMTDGRDGKVFRYIGYYSNDKFHGIGILEYEDGEFYRGEFREGRKFGWGLQKSGNVIYEGFFRKDVIDGYGVLRTLDGKFIKHGCFNMGKMEKFGIVKNSVGDVYCGYLKEDEMDGIGFLRWDAGNSYFGEWFCGKKHGRGIFNWKSKDQFIGYYVADLKNGKGVYTFSRDNYKLSGEWKKGLREGKFVMREENQEYELFFKEGRQVMSGN